MGAFRIFVVTAIALVVTVIVVSLGYLAAPHLPFWGDRLAAALFVFCGVGYIFRIRCFGRVIIGGMDNAVALAFGTGLLSLVGLTIPFVELRFSLPLLSLLLLFIAGLTSLLFGICAGRALD
jgi:hypothetical protein